MSAHKLPVMSTAETVRLADMLSLPFIVADRAPPSGTLGRRGFWRDANTGNYGADNETGFAWALRLREYYARSPGTSPLLTLIVRDMRELGKLGGVEIGFLESLDLWAAGRILARSVAGGGP